MFRVNHKLLPTPKTTGYQCDMMMAYPNAAIEYTTQGCVVTLCCVKREMFLEKKELELSFLDTDRSDGTDKMRSEF